MTNARPFSIFTLRDLFNDTKNTPIRGVLPLAVELWTFGSPGGLQVPNFGSVGLHPHTWPKVGLRHSRSQFFTCHAIFNCHAYTQLVDRIISYKSSSFSICDVAFRGTLPTPQALKPNTFNSYFEANLTNASFGNGGHSFAKVTSLSHSYCVLERVRLVTFWSLCLCTTQEFPKIRTFILAWSWCRGPLIEVESLPCLAFSATKPCTSFKCLVNNHLAQYATMQVPTLHFHFDPTFVHSLSFQAKLGGQVGASGWKTWSISSSEPTPKITKKKSLLCN
jgi:hypothetical protein